MGRDFDRAVGEGQRARSRAHIQTLEHSLRVSPSPPTSRRFPTHPSPAPESVALIVGGRLHVLSKILFDTIQPILGTTRRGRLSRSSPVGALGSSVAFGQRILSRRLGTMVIRTHRVLCADSGRRSWKCSRRAGSRSVRRKVGTRALGI